MNKNLKDLLTGELIGAAVGLVLTAILFSWSMVIFMAWTYIVMLVCTYIGGKSVE